MRAAVPATIASREGGEAAETLGGLVKPEGFEVGPFSVLAGGTGPPLGYVSGLLPVAGVDSTLSRLSGEFSPRPFADARTVVYANRRRGLPGG